MKSKKVNIKLTGYKTQNPNEPRSKNIARIKKENIESENPLYLPKDVKSYYNK